MGLSKTAKTRLTKLIEYMQSLPKDADKHFNMSRWFSHNSEDHHGFKIGEVISKKHLTACGTVACALGWAATMPSIKRIGLTCEYDRGWGTIKWKGKGMNSFEAGANAFGISQSQSEYLFCGIDADTPKAWAKNAKKFIREDGEIYS